jgi:hypothetical protein
VELVARLVAERLVAGTPSVRGHRPRRLRRVADDRPGRRPAAAAGDDRIVVLTGIDTKGLEFDGIVVLDPDAIEAESPTGRATLYVVLTRATQLLTLVR